MSELVVGLQMQNKETQPSKAIEATLAGVLAVVAMVFQILFMADHLGASAVRSVGAISGDATFGIMELCTGDGVVIIGSDEESGETGHDCPVCTNAAVAEFSDSADLPSPACAPIQLAMCWDIRRGIDAVTQRRKGAQPIRAPPAALI